MALRIVRVFAFVGFVLPWLLLAFCAGMGHMGLHPNTTPLLYACPTSIAALGLDNASVFVGFLGWLLISASNALLYAALGVVVALIATLWNRTRLHGAKS
jgi:hypothetical protein